MDQATSLAAVALNDVAITFGPKVGGYTAVSGIDLSVRPGEYRLHFFHERATSATLERLSRRVTVNGEEGLSLPPISLSESGFLPIPHLNKFGHEYSQAPDEGGVYPAARK